MGDIHNGRASFEGYVRDPTSRRVGQSLRVAANLQGEPSFYTHENLKDARVSGGQSESKLTHFKDKQHLRDRRGYQTLDIHAERQGH